MMNKSDKQFNLFPVSHKDISPQEFLTMREVEKANIKSIEIIPPKIGKNDFGKIRVELKTPLYDVRYNYGYPST